MGDLSSPLFLPRLLCLLVSILISSVPLCSWLTAHLLLQSVFLSHPGRPEGRERIPRVEKGEAGGRELERRCPGEYGSLFRSLSGEERD